MLRTVGERPLQVSHLITSFLLSTTWVSGSRRHNVSRSSLLSAAYDAVKLVVHPPCCGLCSNLMMQHDTTKGAGRNCGDIMRKFRHSRPAKQPTTAILAVQPKPTKTGG